MKVKIIHSEPEALDRVNQYANKLLARTIESHNFPVRSVAMEVNPTLGFYFGEHEYQCSIQIWMINDLKIETEARNGDEILAIYQAVARAKNIMENQT